MIWPFQKKFKAQAGANNLIDKAERVDLRITLLF